MKPVLTHLAAAAIGGAVVLLVALRDTPERHEQLREFSPNSDGNRTDRLAARTEQRLDRPAIAGSPDPSSDDFSAEAYEEFLKKLGAYRPTRAQLMDYVASRDGDPEAIFAAGLILGDLSLIREAYEKAPNNPQYAFMLAARGDVPAEERLAMTQRLLELQPDNAMASYLLASRQLATGDDAAALDSLRQSLSQPDFEDFTRQSVVAVEDAMRSTGSTELGAELCSFWQMPTPHIFGVFDLARELDVENPALSQTDAQERRSLAASIGVRMAEDSPSRNVVTELVGVAIQKISVAGLPDDAPSPFQGMTVADVNDSVSQRRNEVRDNQLPAFGALLELSPAVLGGYNSRLRMLGEYEANLWLRQQPEFTSQPTPDQ